MLNYTTTPTATYYTDKDPYATDAPPHQQLPPPVPVHNFYHPPDFYQNIEKGTADQQPMFHRKSNSAYDATSSDESSDEGDMTDHRQQLLQEANQNMMKHNKTTTKEHSFWQVHSSTTIIAPPCAFEEANIVIDMPPLKPRNTKPKNDDAAGQKQQQTNTSKASTTKTTYTPKALTPLPRLQPVTNVSAAITEATTRSVSDERRPQRQPLYLANQVRSVLGSVMDEIDEMIDAEWSKSRELLQKALNQPVPPTISLHI